LLKALHPGTGGARPKCNIVADNALWIAKFPSVEDVPWVSIPRLEHATMRLAEACGIRSAQTRIETVGGRDVCLVKRFDCAITADGRVVRNGFVSARTIFFADPGYATVGTGSYGRLARWMTRYGCVADEQQQLFRRMVFNVAVRNSDDHELNHGLVQVNGRFCLADAYDVLPMLSTNRIHQHALLIGDSAAGTVENLISNAAAFGVSWDAAKAIVSDIQQAIRDQWQDIFHAAGLGDDEINRLGRYFAPIALRAQTPP
jgi:serine/threonine-protein kinase HipA